MRLLPLLLLPTLALAAEPGLGSLPTVPLEQLSNPTLPPHGAQALAARPGEWRHGESTHFIVHFANSRTGTEVAQEADFFYRTILKELRATPPLDAPKSHLFIFESPEEWEAFARSVSLEEWTGAVTIGGAIYVPRNVKYRFKNHALGHEIAHLLIRRFVGTQMPLWLEEGYAEDVAIRGYAAYYRARGYATRPSARAIPTYLPLRELTAYTAYPPAEKVASFYMQSRRLVWFLNGFGDKERFVKFLLLSAQGKPLEHALRDAYGSRWFSLDDLEKAFRNDLEK